MISSGQRKAMYRKEHAWDLLTNEHKLQYALVSILEQQGDRFLCRYQLVFHNKTSRDFDLLLPEESFERPLVTNLGTSVYTPLQPMDALEILMHLAFEKKEQWARTELEKAFTQEQLQFLERC